MINPWHGLEERLRAIANNKANGGCNGVALICINLLFDQSGNLLGWYKPQRIQLEPKSLDVSCLIAGQKRLGTWENTLSQLENSVSEEDVIVNTFDPSQNKIVPFYTIEGKKRSTIDKTLVVLDGQPVGFL